MSLLRSRTAPQPLSDLPLSAPSRGQIPRTASSSALQLQPIKTARPSQQWEVRTFGPLTPRHRETDPFSLGGFYPAESVDDAEWLEHASDSDQGEPLIGDSEIPEDDNSLDAETAIAKEDKFGILSINPDLIFGDKKEDKLMSPYSIEDSAVLDDESLYQAIHRQRVLKGDVEVVDSDEMTTNLFFGDNKLVVDGWLGKIFA